MWYEGAGTGDRRWLHADTQNSVIGYSDSSGNSGATYAYDPYGLPDTWSASASRYRYTGQTLIPEAHLYDYKARMYDPMAGRFLQTDPVGYDSDINLYAYAGNDPINWGDPSGMACDTTNWVKQPDGGYLPSGDIIACGTALAGSGGGAGVFGGSANAPGNKIGKPQGVSRPAAPLQNVGPVKNPDCDAARSNLADIGNQIKEFEQGLQWAGLGIDVIGILGDEAGAGEALQAGATSAALGGLTLASAGAGLQTYAKTGKISRAAAVAGLSAAADFAAGRATYGLGKIPISKLSPETIKLLSELTASAAEAAQEVKDKCGG